MDFKEPVLWSHQEAAAKRALSTNNFAFLFDCGTGKTLTTIKVLRHVYAGHKRIIPTLILAPVIVLRNWRDEFLKFSKISEDKICVLSGPTKKRMAILDKFVERHGDSFIIITNYESLVANEAFYNMLKVWRPQALVMDESHRIKSISSKRTKKVIELADNANYRYMLTGTPVLNNAMDLFSQYRALDGGKIFGQNFFSFRAKFFEDKNAKMPKHIHFPNWIIKPSAQEEMGELINSISAKAKKEDCLDLPPLVKQTIYVDLTPQQKRMYEEMRKHFLTAIDDNMVMASIALTKSLRMLQITSGFTKDEDGKEHSLKSPKAEALKELLTDIVPGHKVIVWAIFKENYEQIKKVCDQLKIKFVEAHGSITNKQKYDNVEAFNNDSDVRVFIGHPGSLGIGINLISASHCIYFSRGYSLGDDIQSEARNYRGGSEIHNKVTRIDIVAKDTLDEIIMEILQEKEENAEKVLARVRSKL